jgi:hypothetical protein
MKVYIFLNKPYVSIDKLINAMLKSNIKYYSNIQDCYDYMVYMNSIDIPDESKIISFGLIYTIDESRYIFEDKNEYDEYINDNLEIIKKNIWYDELIN